MRDRWMPPLVLAALLLFGALAILIGTRDTPPEPAVVPAQHGVTSPAP